MVGIAKKFRKVASSGMEAAATIIHQSSRLKRSLRTRFSPGRTGGSQAPPDKNNSDSSSFSNHNSPASLPTSPPVENPAFPPTVDLDGCGQVEVQPTMARTDANLTNEVEQVEESDGNKAGGNSDKLSQVLKQDQEKHIEAAIQWASQVTKPNSKLASISSIAARYNIPRSTFRRRYLGLAQPRHIAQKTRQRLTPEQESVLVNWIILLGERGTPLNRNTVSTRVKAIDGKGISRSWFRRFVRRHPRIKAYRPSGLDPKRAQAFNPTVVRQHFTLFHDEILQRLGIPWENIYNMDENNPSPDIY